MKSTTAVIGRKQELAILEEALHSNEAEMVAVIGRRRVGKTFLVTQAYAQHIVFELTYRRDSALPEGGQTWKKCRPKH